MKDIPLTTEVHLPKPDFEINHHSPILMIGSCFSDNIGALLETNKFNVLKNPFGVLYNPASIAQLLTLSLKNNTIEKYDLVFHNNQWHSLLFHGSFSATDPQLVLNEANKAIHTAHSFLKRAKFLIVTFGTSWVYAYKNSQQVVSNCHKIPDKEFDRYKLRVEAICNEWEKLLEQLHHFNPTLKIIFTISPIRHLKDGAYENQISKSTLFVAIDELMKISKYHQLNYFPAYEIVMDELRDYRFYASDLIHLSELTVHYIFNRFQRCFFSEETLNCMKEIKKVVQAKEHRIMTRNISEIKQFGEDQLKAISQLQLKYPEIDFNPDIAHFKNLIEMKPRE